MKHILTEAEIELNPQLGSVGDSVDQKDIIYPVIPTNFVGGQADNILRHSNSPHSMNNRINVMDGDTLIRTYSGTENTNWKKHAELYAQINGYTLAAYKLTKSNDTRPSTTKTNQSSKSSDRKSAKTNGSRRK